MNRVIVIGGGASGLVAAINAARYGNEVIILERNNSCGKKILVTGNGRCNYFNEDFTSNHYDSYDRNLIDNIINDNNKKKVMNFFDSIGVIPNIKNGYYYPHSNQSVSILNALMIEINRLNIKVICNTLVLNIKKVDGIFEIVTNDILYKCDKAIIATGSMAYYREEVNSYDLLSGFGHSIIKPLPALVQLRSNNKICKKWAGVRVNSKIKLYENNKFIKDDVGELMLTNYGISGICAMQLSGLVAKGLDRGDKEEIVINFVPDIANNQKELLEFLDNYNKNHNFKVSEIVDNLINYKLGNALNDKINDFYYNDLSMKQREIIANNLTNFKVNIIDINSFKEAQTCSGGIPLSEINLETMESLKVKNLFFTGEVVDLNGDCGGYNLGFAWISGILAGGVLGD